MYSVSRARPANAVYVITRVNVVQQLCYSKITSKPLPHNITLTALQV